MKIKVTPLGFWAKLADLLMTPIMYVLLGTFCESPQRTHRWNNHHLDPSQTNLLDNNIMVHHAGTEQDKKNRFHLPIIGGILKHLPPLLGGLKNYVVLRPEDFISVTEDGWYVGWSGEGAFGVSRIRLTGSVRLLVGPGNIAFFGINAKTGKQIKIEQISTGTTGKGGPYSKVPLL